MGILADSSYYLTGEWGRVMGQAQEKESFMNFATAMWLLAIVGLGLLGVSLFTASNEDGSDDSSTVTAAENTVPVGKVRMEGEALPVLEVIEEVVAEAEPAAAEAAVEEVASEAPDPGKQVYSTLCFSCHGTGLPGIPQLGDKDAWAGRIAEGKALLYERALTGFTGKSGMPMPPKGGNMNLSDDEVKAAVDYMVANAE